MTTIPNYQSDLNVQQNCLKIQQLLNQLTYKPKWSFNIISQSSYHKLLQINIITINSNASSKEELIINHQFPIYYHIQMTIDQIERWILDCILLVEQHEACEIFKINGKAIYYPEHGFNSRPYTIERQK